MCTMLIQEVKLELEVSELKMPGVSILGNMVIGKETVTKSTASDLKMPRVLVVRKMAVCSRGVNQPFLEAMVFCI